MGNKEIILPYVADIPIGKTGRVRKLTSEYYAKLWDFEIHVAPGFVWDGASIPRLFWSLIGSPFTGTHSRPAFIHDCLYATEFEPKKYNDWLFLELLDYTECNWIKRNIMWSAVKSCGWSAYMKHTKETISDARTYITIRKFQ